jgi:hypothetical protein
MPQLPIQNWHVQDLGLNKIDPVGSYQEGKGKALELALSEYKRQAESFRAPHYKELADIEPKVAQAGLEKSLLENKYYAPNIQSEIELRGAQAQDQRALANLHKPEGEMKQLMLNEYKKLLQQGQQGGGATPGASQSYMTGGLTGDVSGAIPQNMGYQPSGAYGIQAPQPTPQDLLNKNLFGQDTFEAKQKQAFEQMKVQNDMFVKKTAGLNDKVKSNQDQMNLFMQYKDLMESTAASGSVGQYIPGMFSSSQKSIENLISQMSLPALQNVRAAAGAGIRNIPELNAALNQKPQLGWNQGTIDYYNKSMIAENNRDMQASQFYNHIKENPNLGIDSGRADQLFQNFQKHFPLVDEKGKVHPEMGQGNNWRYWTTPDAVKSMNDTGDYNPVKNISQKIERGEIKLPTFETKESREQWWNSLDNVMKAAIKKAVKEKK